MARAGNLEITKLLIEKGASVDDTDNDGNNAYTTPETPPTNTLQQSNKTANQPSASSANTAARRVKN